MQLQSRTRLPRGSAFGAARPRRCRLAVRAQATTGRRGLLSALGLLGTFGAAQAAQAADAYEELKALSAARTGSGSLLESFQATKGSVTGGKADRGIREKLAAEASNAPKAPKPKASASSGGLKPSAAKPAAGGLKPSAAKPAAPKPAAPAPAAALRAPAPAAPKPAAPKPAVPKPAPAVAAAAGAGGGFAVGPLVQAVGVLGLVGVGASAATSAATSKPKPKPAAPAAAAAPKPGSTVVSTAAPARAASPAPARAASPAPARAASPVAARAASPVSGSTRKIVTKVPTGTAVASGSTVKAVVKQALVNEEKPEEPTDFAVAGILGAAGVLAGFFLFGLPQPIPSGPVESAAVNDPLVLAAKEAGVAASQRRSYDTPLFKAADAPAVAERKAIVVAPPPKAEAPKAAAPKLELPVPALAKPAPAPVVAAAPAPAKLAPSPAAKPAPVAAKPVAEADEAASAPSPVLLAVGGIAVVVGAFALVGGDSSSETAPAAASVAPAAAAGAGTGDAGAAESVAATASAASAAAAAAPGEGATNAAYDQAVLALMGDPEATDDLYSVMSSGDAPLKNIPALAWSLVSNPANAERLDGFAFQKLSKSRHERVRALLLSAGLSLPEAPVPQAGAEVSLAPVDDASAAVDPDKLRSVFEALLANEASRTLMRGLLQGAGMPFNEEAFEEQVKDASYFNLAIAPILRKMPQQKLRVLAELQDPEKLQQLVASVATLAKDGRQLRAVTTELSGDVKQTVATIREEQEGGTPTASRG